MIAVCLLAYDNCDRICECIRRFHIDTDLFGLKFDFHVYNLGYPLPEKRYNTSLIRAGAGISGALYYDMENKGQDGNINQVFGLLRNSKPEYSQVIFYDADVAPKDPKWLKDTLRVFNGDPNCHFVTMNCSATDNALCQQTEHSTVAGVPVAKLKWGGGWPVLMFSKTFVDHGYPVMHSFYGATEPTIQATLNARGWTGYMMREHDDARNLLNVDAKYQQWKSYAIDKKDAMSFEKWLESQS